MSNKMALDALTKILKIFERDAFDIWLEAKSPSGDVEQVQRQWESSSEYSEFCDKWADARAAIAALQAAEPTYTDDLELRYAEVCEERDHLRAVLRAQSPAQEPVVQATSDTARRLAAEFRGTVARKDFEAWGEEVLPLLDGMAAASVVQADDFDEDWIPLTDADRQRAFESMPNMLEGFLKTWGWLHFANAIEEICREKNADRASSGAAQAAPFAKDSWQHAVDNQLVAFGRTSQEFTNPHEAIAWLAIMNMELGQSNVGAAQAVRMLTTDEILHALVTELQQPGGVKHTPHEIVQRKFCAVNGLRIPADGKIGDAA